MFLHCDRPSTTGSMRRHISVRFGPSKFPSYGINLNAPHRTYRWISEIHCVMRPGGTTTNAGRSGRLPSGVSHRLFAVEVLTTCYTFKDTNSLKCPGNLPCMAKYSR